jgi:D-alanine-D-alanine ligase
VSERLRLGILFGGRSVEHEVSIISARGVAAALKPTDFIAVPLGVTGEGRWLSPELSRSILESEAGRVEPPPGEDDGVRVLIDPGGGGIIRSEPGKPAEKLAVDVIFPLVHGWGGEDGRVQGALELASIPYIGAGVLGSATGMDKAIAKRLFELRGLPVAPWIELGERACRSDGDEIERTILDEIGLPLFVKPANGGSSVGITRVGDAGELRGALEEALACDRKIVVERGLDAREIECAVLGNDEPRPSVLGEIIPSGEFYDYAAKYIDDASELRIPAELDPRAAARIQGLALEAFRALDLSGFARVDFLVDRASGEPFLNEVNTLPGFTPISMFPKLWEATGLDYPRLIETLVDLARDQWRLMRRLRTRWEPQR